MEKLQKYKIKPSFNPVEVAKYSVGACFLCEWVLAYIDKFAPKFKNPHVFPVGHHKCGDGYFEKNP